MTTRQRLALFFMELFRRRITQPTRTRFGLPTLEARVTPAVTISG